MLPVPSAIAGLLGIDTVSWKDRLREAAYTSPGGTRIRFDYEDVKRVTPKRTAVFEFPGVDGAYIQDNGFGARQYPLRCFFWGDNHDRIATAFEAALLERGEGKLEHPLYGTPTVVPVGDIERRDDLKTAANQTILEVSFWTTVGAIYPSAQTNPRNEILDALEGFDVAAAQQFQDATTLSTAVTKANTISTIRKVLRDISATMQAVADVTTSVSREFRDAQSTVNYGLDVLIGQPLQLAQQITNLIKAPARALAGIESRLEAYEALAVKLFGSRAASDVLDASTLGSLQQRISNDFHTMDLSILSAVAGSALSVVENQFTTKPEAIAAAAAVLAQFDAAVVWRDGRFDSLSQVDPGGSYQALQSAVALVAGYLVEVSFDLVPERAIVIDRPRTIVDLAAELYGSVDDRLDFLIDTNGLTGSEILELPRGRRIVYYA